MGVFKSRKEDVWPMWMFGIPKKKLTKKHDNGLIKLEKKVRDQLNDVCPLLRRVILVSTL